MASRLLFLLGCLAVCAAADGAERQTTVAGLSVMVWANDSPAAQPVVIFSTMRS